MIKKNPFTLRSNMQQLKFSPTLAINERVRMAKLDGVEVLHMGFGQSPFPVHPIIKTALEGSSGANEYLPSSGLDELRIASKDYYIHKLGLDLRRYDAVVGPGSKALIFAIQMAVEGDLLLPVPSWVSYGPQSELLQDQVIPIPTEIKDNYHITAQSLEWVIHEAKKEGKNPKKLILNYPNNPTGLTIDPQRLADISQVCRKYEVLVISDEIYGLTNYLGDHKSIASFFPDGTIITTGLSKHLSLGGYRLGVALIPENLNAIQAAVTRFASETWSCVAAPIQFAALKAFENDKTIETYIQTCNRIHQRVTGYLRDYLLKFGIEYPSPQGGFYLYPDFGIYQEPLNRLGIHTSEQLALLLLEKQHLATLPGSAFGDKPENLRLRLASCDYNGQFVLDTFTAEPERSPDSFIQACCPKIQLGCQRLQEFFEVL